MSPEERWFPSHLKELDKAECLELLASHQVGRVAYCDDLGPVVLPVNYVVGNVRTVLLRVSPHSTLARNLRSAPASFEVDDFDDFNQSGWSVLVRGDAAYVDIAELPGENTTGASPGQRVSACSTSGSPRMTSRAAGADPPERTGRQLARRERDPDDDAHTLRCPRPRPGRAGNTGTLGAQHPALALVRRRRAHEPVRRQIAPAPVRRPGRPGSRDQLGAALQHLQVAAAAAGWKAQVRRMPNPYNDNQLASVSFRPEQTTPEALTALDALIQRRTDRRRPSSGPVPRERLDGLLALGPAAGVTVLGVVTHARRASCCSFWPKQSGHNG